MFVSRHLLRNAANCLLFRASQARSLAGSRTMSSAVRMLDVTPDRKLAYRVHEGSKTDPTVVFVPGFMSTMDGFKATALENFCVKHDRRYIRFDFEGIGKSPGDLSQLYIRYWIEDLKCIVENLVPQQVLLVGSSMGGWDKATLDSGKVLVLKKNFGEIFLRKSLMEESINHHLDLSKPIPITAPIRILHGVLDGDVPYKQSLQIMQAVTSKDVDVTFRKDGKHQLSEPADLEMLIRTLQALLPAEEHQSLKQPSL
ncbi:hypothetical protein B566_EDAN000774 [Ephemera danica]|nr:hypothetical protein B566_EDAN000774 [Ephemera danica]